jgi:hypothetical protein
MSSFVKHVLSRHIETDNHVKPRLRARYEPVKTFSNPHTGNETDALEVTREPDQIDSLPEQDGLNAAPAATQTASERAADPPSKFFRQNESIDNGFSKPLLYSNPLQKNNPALLHEEMKNISDQITPSGIQLAGQQAFSLHTNREITNGVKDQTFSKPHVENNTVQPAVGSHFGSEKTAPTISNPHAAENVTSAMKSSTTSRPNERGNDALQEALNQFQKSQNGKQSAQQQVEMGPVIRVTIGRIEVQAIVQSTPLPAKQVTKATPKLSLDDYLKQRNHPST